MEPDEKPEPSGLKYLSIKELQESGLLQEVNRLFFHPRGLALEIQADPEKVEWKLGGIWDFRDDPEGIHFDIANRDPQVQDLMRYREYRVDQMLRSHMAARIELFGSHIEPIPLPGEEGAGE